MTRRVLPLIVGFGLLLGIFGFANLLYQRFLFADHMKAAVTAGDLRTVRALLRDGADPNLQFQRNIPSTPLMLASFAGHRAIVDELLQRGAQVGTRDRWGNSALSLAVQAQEPEIVRLLLKHGADARTFASEGRSLLRLNQESDWNGGEQRPAIRHLLKQYGAAD